MAFAMNMDSRPTGIVGGASVICMTSLRPNAWNEFSTASSSPTICAAATASIRERIESPAQNHQGQLAGPS
jgi:hypothetical protein